MRANPTNQKKSNEREDIFSFPKYDKDPFTYYKEDQSKKESKEKNGKYNPDYSNFGNNGNKYFGPKKRAYKDIFLSKIGVSNEQKEKQNEEISYQKMDNFKEEPSSYINSFYNEPSLIKKISNNSKKKISNISKSSKKEQISDEYESKEKDKDIEISTKKKLEDKKLINEYGKIIEKILKEEQILFLDDNYHTSPSPSFEKIPENYSSYIISKRVNFPKEIYQTFPSLDNNENENNNDNDNENNFTVVFPPLNCIIFVKKNILTFFNYITENTYNYLELPKPVKKLLITIPKPGIFINEIKFIMICVMEGEIHLLTLAFRNIDDDLPIIHKTDFIFNFKETVIDIISTANHRIFLSTLSNKIFELDYTVNQSSYLNFFGAKNSLFATNRESPSFFGILSDIRYIFKKRIEVINKLKVDDTRKILYAIKYAIPNSETGVNYDKAIDSSIIVFDLGIDGKGFTKMLEISQEDLGEYGYDYYNNFNYDENNMNENNEELIQKNNLIIDITPLTRDKFKDYQLLVIKRNGNKYFLRFNTYTDDSFIKNQDNILSFNNSEFYRERITDRYFSVSKQIPFSNNNLNKNLPVNDNILYEMINYFPFSTFCYFKQPNITNETNDEFTLNVIEENLSSIAKKENLKLSNQLGGLKETEEILFKSSTDTKKLFSITKLSDYNLEDCYDLGNLLKYSSNGFFISNNTKYIDDNLGEVISYNNMHEYARQLFYSPEEIGILFSDEFVIYKKLRPIDKLIEIIINKNSYNNRLDDINIYNKSYDPINPSSETINIISNDKKRLSMPSYISMQNGIKNPLQINRNSLMYSEFKKFVSIHGYIETSVMLLNIITNSNFCYYIKNIILYPNDMNYKNNLNMNDLRRYYLNPNTLRKIKNETQFMNLGQEYLFNLFKVAEEDINLQINNYQILLQNLLDKGIRESNINNNLKYKFNDNNNINQNNTIITNILFEAKNFLIYGFGLFLSRIMRLLWEEKFFVKKKLYYQNDNFEFTVANNLNQNQIMFIRNILIKFVNSINQYKMELLQKSSDIDTLSNKLRNCLNDVEQFIKNNSPYTINEIKKKLSKEDIQVLDQHKKNLNYFLKIYSFEKFSKDLNIIIGIAKRGIEILNLVDNVYKIDIAKEIQKRKRYNILNIKIKDIYKNNYPFIISELLQIIYEFYFKEKSMEFATIKLQEIIQQSPNVVNINSANAIEGNFILKFCNHYQMDDIDKIKYIKDAVEKINLNLLSVKIEKVVNYLSSFDQIENIVKLCLKKGKILHSEINLNIDNNQNKLLFNDYDYENDNNKDLNQIESDINKIEEENNSTEFYKCINIILDILNYLHNSIIYNSLEKYLKKKYPRTKEFSCPSYIKNLLSNRTINEYIFMEKLVLNLIFDEKYEYIHHNIIEFLKENNMMNKLQELNSSSVEKYLNNQISLNDNSPKSLFSMFNFYYRNKNYSSATKILATLLNYDNSLNGDLDINNRVSLDDRITYVNLMLETLDLQINDAEYVQIPEQRTKEINEAKSLKENIINMRNILKIQNEIKNYLISYVNNLSGDINNNDNNNMNDLDEFKDAIIILDNKPMDLNTLYNLYAKKFHIFDCCMSIFFQIKFSSGDKNEERVDVKEVKNIYLDYFCNLTEETLSINWPWINFERFNRIFNMLIKEKTQYQNFYDMLINNGMKNKYKDIIPLEFIISIIESMNRKIIFYNEEFNNGDNYLMKIKYSYNQTKNPFWFITYLKQQIYLPISYIFNEYYIIYRSIIKDNNMKKINLGNNINNINNSNLNDNISMHTFNSYANKTANILEEYGMVFDGNLKGDINKKMSPDNKFYILFLLLTIAKMWINRIIDYIDDNNNDLNNMNNNKQIKQAEFDLKQFNLEIKKNGNEKIKKLIKEFFEELQKCNMLFSHEKCKILKNFGDTIEKEIKITENKVIAYYSESNSFDNSNYGSNNNNRILKVNINDKSMDNNNNIENIFGGGNNKHFSNLMKKF